MNKPRQPRSSPLPAEDIHVRIQNTIAILSAESRTLDAHAQQDLRLAVETLQAADAAVQTLEQELDLVTAPDLQAAEEVQRLRQELEAAQLETIEQQQEVAELRDKLQMETDIQAEERQRLAVLEQKSKAMEDVLGSDDAAFGRFMDHALEQDQKQGRIRDR